MQLYIPVYIHKIQYLITDVTISNICVCLKNNPHVNFVDNFISSYGGIHLPLTCKINYVNMKHEYVQMRLIYVNIQHDPIDMQHK